MMGLGMTVAGRLMTRGLTMLWNRRKIMSLLWLIINGRRGPRAIGSFGRRIGIPIGSKKMSLLGRRKRRTRRTMARMGMRRVMTVGRKRVRRRRNGVPIKVKADASLVPMESTYHLRKREERLTSRKLMAVAAGAVPLRHQIITMARIKRVAHRQTRTELMAAAAVTTKRVPRKVIPMLIQTLIVTTRTIICQRFKRRERIKIKPRLVIIIGKTGL
mmetsp:Transcript_28036/g.34132  ORF Transcript_28036/g.34132 Transcript_28036/m.34132 type:complete len:216 (-) Transcript_28036:200-847(-)